MSRNATYISAPFYKLSFGDVALQQQAPACQSRVIAPHYVQTGTHFCSLPVFITFPHHGNLLQALAAKRDRSK
jgi:hypothetical protein